MTAADRPTFRVSAFTVIIDSLVATLQQRSQAYEGISARFDFLRNVRSVSSEELYVQSAALVEWSIASQPDATDDDIDVITTGEAVELRMYRLITENTMQSCFPNVEILLRMYLCLMVTNCTGDRSFSKLRRIKNAQRTTIWQGRVNILLMSIESELLRTIDVNSIIDDFARVKARKHNM